MKKIAVLYPFLSQQDKGLARFLFKSCGSTKILRFIGEQLLDLNLVDEVRFAAPYFRTWGEDLTSVIPSNWIQEVQIPPDNRLQRLTWNPEDWDELFRDASIVFNMHELLGWVFKGLRPSMKVINMFTVAPTGEPWPWMVELMNLAIRSGDLVTAPSKTMAEYIRSTHKKAETVIWPLSFDAKQLDYLLALPESGKHPIDILFVFRASSSNYTHHREFILALPDLIGWDSPGLNIAFTDPTRYLRNNMETELDWLSDHRGSWGVEILEDPSNQEQFVDLLRRSRIVIGMNDNMHGGMGVREAMYCGALPVLMDAPCYRELIGGVSMHYPAWIPVPVTPGGIAKALNGMLGFKDQPPISRAGLRVLMKERAECESFQHTWNLIMYPQIVDLLSRVEK